MATKGRALAKDWFRALCSHGSNRRVAGLAGCEDCMATRIDVALADARDEGTKIGYEAGWRDGVAAGARPPVKLKS